MYKLYPRWTNNLCYRPRDLNIKYVQLTDTDTDPGLRTTGLGESRKQKERPVTQVGKSRTSKWGPQMTSDRTGDSVGMLTGKLGFMS